MMPIFPGMLPVAVGISVLALGVLCFCMAFAERYPETIDDFSDMDEDE